MKVTGKTKVFAVLGHPIGHTLSPLMHNTAFQALNMDAVYLAFDVSPDRLMNMLPAMKELGFGGVNLTAPLKEVAFHGLPRLDESARLLGAVNTIRFDQGGMIGFNTDGDGFLRAIEESFGQLVTGLSVFVLGTGGAGRATALMCARAKAKSITLVDKDVVRCERTASEIRERFRGIHTQVIDVKSRWAEASRAADLVVQATPVGMKKDDTPLCKADAFRAGQWAFDLIYMYPETAFMKEAKAAGARTANGLGMLLHQGAKAFEIWTGVVPPIDVMRKALEKEVYPK